MPLKHGDGTDATINGIFHPRLGLIGKRIHCIFSLVRHQFVQQLAYVACAEDLVNISELLGLFWWEVRRKGASVDTFPPQEFAGSAWGVRV